MFKKPFRIKSNCQLKNSEKKKLQTEICDLWNTNVIDIGTIIPLKEPIFLLKIFTHSSEQILVYRFHETPIIFKFKNDIFPTIFLLWKYPFLINSICVFNAVTRMLSNGADLMIPGVNVKKNSELYNNKTLPKDSKVYINTDINAAAFAVGKTIVDISEMLIPKNKGKAVLILHSYGDELWKLDESNRLPDSPLPHPEFSEEINVDEIVETNESFVNNSEVIPSSSQSCDTEIEKPQSSLESVVSELPMEELLLYCFIKSLKMSSLKNSLPILANVFYKNMLKVAPENLSLDIKKTKYKKLSQFLVDMEKKNILKVSNVKGVLSITDVNLQHEDILYFKDIYQVPSKPIQQSEQYQIKEKHIINSAVRIFFLKFHFKRGESITEEEMRTCVVQYIKKNELTSENSKSFVRLDATLRQTLNCKADEMLWKDIFEGLSARMGKCYEILTPKNVIIKGKGVLPLIELSVVSKTSNKKVTIVNNLECYGINVAEFAKDYQHFLAASTTVTELPYSKSSVQIQGNHVIFIEKSLTEKYFIPKKCIKNNEKGKKDQKKE